MRDRFYLLTDRLTSALGSIQAVVLSALVIVVWAISGPFFHFSDTWQLVINTSTTIVTFWMVFVIQASANRNSRALHLKLDEIIRATGAARNEFIVEEHAGEQELERHEQELEAQAKANAAAEPSPPDSAGLSAEPARAVAGSGSRPVPGDG